MPSPPPAQDRASLPATSLALTALAAPPLAVFTPLALAPLLALLAVVLVASGPRAALAEARPYAGLAALLAALSLWAAVTALWSPAPLHSLVEALRFLALSAAGLVALGAATALPEAAAARAGRALLAGLALALLLLLVERFDHDVLLRAAAHIPRARYISPARYDRGVTVLLLLAWPAAALLLAWRRWLFLALLGIAVGVAVFSYESHTCKLAFVTAAAAAVVALVLPRLAARLMLAVVVLAAFVLPPALPEGAGIAAIERRLPEMPGSAVHRLAIWRFTADRIAERPLGGWGMDASRAVPGGTGLVRQLYPEIAIAPDAQLLPLHPHDAALQWRLELGLPGTLLALVFLGLVLERLARARLTPAARAIALGYAAAALTVALLSFGAWQAWWLSTLWLAAAFLTPLARARSS
jgi:O-antigen ligase